MSIPITRTARLRAQRRIDLPRMPEPPVPTMYELAPWPVPVVSADSQTIRQVGFSPANPGGVTVSTCSIKRTWRNNYVVKLQGPEYDDTTMKGIRMRNELQTIRGQCDWVLQKDRMARKVAMGLARPKSTSSDATTTGVPVTPELPALHIGEDDVFIPDSESEKRSPDQLVSEPVKAVDTSDQIREEALACFAAEQEKADKANLPAVDLGPIILAEDAVEPPIIAEKEEVFGVETEDPIGVVVISQVEEERPAPGAAMVFGAGVNSAFTFCWTRTE